MKLLRSGCRALIKQKGAKLRHTASVPFLRGHLACARIWALGQSNQESNATLDGVHVCALYLPETRTWDGWRTILLPACWVWDRAPGCWKRAQWPRWQSQVWDLWECCVSGVACESPEGLETSMSRAWVLGPGLGPCYGLDDDPGQQDSPEPRRRPAAAEQRGSLSRLRTCRGEWSRGDRLPRTQLSVKWFSQREADRGCFTGARDCFNTWEFILAFTEKTFRKAELWPWSSKICENGGFCFSLL